MIDVEFDDRKYTGAHYGHLCRAQVRLNGVTIIDERDGGMRNDIYEMKKEPGQKGRSRQASRRAAAPPIQSSLDAGNGTPSLSRRSATKCASPSTANRPAISSRPASRHATKSKIELGVAGKDGFFDDIKVWNAEPATP